MKRLRLLVVDDEEYIRLALRKWFEGCGFDVDVADDGDVAVELCRSKTYDAITMDLVMPRMNGSNAIEAIRAIHPHVPIVVLTGYQDRLSDLGSLGVSKILSKPLALHDLEQEIRSLLPATA